MKKNLLLFLAFCITINPGLVKAQSGFTQTIKGVVTDADSKKPLSLATVNLLNSKIHVLTDSLGQFRINGVAVGRHSVTVSNLGYDSKTIAEIMVSSGKEVFVNIALTETVQTLKEVSVSSRKNRTKSLNEFATASARQFSVEDTKRYPAAANDPARMAQNFAGVSNNGDGSNEIVVRGNSPKGILWRLEGIEIPNPNHFSALGSSGGSISMLSSSTLGNSDFYTGAFPAEFGNATSGAFDLNFRNGNKDKNEYALMIGGLGVEAAAEGPFRKGGQSSYLINYRYSTLSLLKSFLSSLNGVMPDYQDISFKLNFPTKSAGTFSVFGLGGINKAIKDPAKDSTKWNDDDPNFVLDSKGKTGVIGMSHQYFFNRHAYLKTIISASATGFNEVVDSLNPVKNYGIEQIGRTHNSDGAYRISVMYNNKLNAHHTFRSGIVASHLTYDFNSRYYDDVDKLWKVVLNGKGNTQYYQAYAQWKYRINNKFTLNTGFHTSMLELNKTYSVEPRTAITYQASHNQTITVAAGIHAKPEHLSTYTFIPGNASDLPNKNLEMPKAAHFVLGYEKGFISGWRLKGEAYYQHLYDVPVEEKAGSYFSILNASKVYDLSDIGKLVSDGKGKNYGVDITVEKPFNKSYYVMFTGSLMQSLYTNYSGKEYNTRYNRGYQGNLVAGKEWKTGADGKNIFGLNAKMLGSGGLRQSPIDLEASRKRGKVEYVQDRFYSEKGPAYYRFDIGISYKVNKKYATHTFMFDIQNVTDHQNLYYEYYDKNKGVIKQQFQMGFFPVINYRIEF